MSRYHPDKVLDNAHLYDPPDCSRERRKAFPCGDCLYFESIGWGETGLCLLAKRVALPPWVPKNENYTVDFNDTCELFEKDGPLT